MRVLVTGSAGLIGRWVAERLLLEKNEVVGLDLLPAPFDARGYNHCRCSILDAAALQGIFARTAPDAVIHLAARIDLTGVTANDYPANIDGIRNVVAAVRDTPSVRRAIYTSSQLVCRVGYIPRSDQDYCPSTPYGESKVRTEQIVRASDGGEVEWVLCRPTTVWGPHMHPHYVRMLHLIERGIFFHCGKQKLFKSYAYAGNIAWQYCRLLTAPAEQIHRRVFYLADYQPLSLREYTDRLALAMGAPPIRTFPLWLVHMFALGGDLLNMVGFRRFPFNRFRLGNILQEYVFDLGETRRVCGELPYSWEQGVQATVDWYRETTCPK